MISYSQSHVFSPAALELLRRAEFIVSELPEPVPSSDAEFWRCHEVARAVGTVLGLTVVDGLYAMVNHSWLLVGEKFWILDVYAIGSLPQVRLVDECVVRDLYQERLPRSDIRQDALKTLLSSAARSLASLEKGLC